MLKQITKNKIYIIISVALLMLSVACTVIFYPYCAVRCYNAIRDFIMSLGNYFANLFDIDFPYSLSFLELPDASMSAHLPFDIAEIERKLQVFFKAFVNIDNFKLFLYVSLKKINNIAVIIMLFLPVVLLLGIALKPFILSPNKRKHSEKTKALIFFEKYIEKYIKIVLFYIKDFFVFCNTKKWYRALIIIVWLVNLNLLPIVFGFLAYYYYFACEFNFLSVFIQIVRLLCDVLVAYQTACFVFWFAVGFYLFNKWRKKVAYDRLDHMEKRNRGFINSLALCVFVTGNTGTGKTTMSQSIAISQAIMFRDYCLEVMQGKWLQFPNFPFSRLEENISILIKKHELYNLACCIGYAEKIKKKFLESQTQENIFGYDFEKYGLYYEGALRYENIFDMVETYIKSFYIYVMDTSLIIANLSIREDDYSETLGNFPIRNSDLFHRTNAQRDEYTHFAHIIDMDMLRICKKIHSENKNNIFEFGVFVISEIDKERLNKVEMQELKKSAKEANQRNDGFNLSFKLDRHPSTIQFKPIIKIISDGQRSQSLNADARELNDVIEIRERSEEVLCMPFFLFGDLVYDLIIPRIKAFLTEFRFYRKDTTLSMYLLENAVSWYYKFYHKIYDTFGTHELKGIVRNGGSEVEAREFVYYIINVKDYADRFGTDCFSEFFYEKSSKMLYGVNDMPTYSGVKATSEELRQQNSYFVISVLNQDEEFEESEE